VKFAATADWLTAEGSYFDTGWIEQKWSCGIAHRFWHQPLQAWCAEFTAAGFAIDAITEHQPPAEMARTHPAECETLARQPGFIAYRLTTEPLGQWDSGTESVKPDETGHATNSVLMFSFAGSLVQAALGSRGGVGGRRNRPGLVA
jgi:hypothetical protein